MTRPEFEVLYTKYQKPWLDLARSLVHDDDIAQDVLQSVVVQLLTQKGGLERVRLEENAESWIRMQIVWYIKRYIWLNPRNHQESANNAISLGGLELVLSSPEPQMEEIETPREQGVRVALSKLDIVDQDILCLHVVAKMPFIEIRRILKLKRTRGAIKKHYFTVILPKFRFALGNVGISAPPSVDNTKPAKAQTAA